MWTITHARPLRLLLVMALLLGGLALRAQNPPPAPPPQQQPPAAQKEEPLPVIRARAELVVVPVTVKDADGQLVSDIRREEFRVFEDAVEQDISVFTNEAVPISAVVLLDNALELKASEQLQKALPSIAAAFGELDEVAVIQFDELPRLVLEFTFDNDALHNHLKRAPVASRFPGGMGSAPMTRGPRSAQGSPEPRVPVRPETRGGFTKNLDDAVYAAGELLRGRGRDRRKIIFLVSDGMNSRDNLHSHDDTIKLLLSADVSVYSIGIAQSTVARGLNPLSRYAGATGGDVFYAASRSALENFFSRVTEQARNQYTLAYAPRGTDRNAEYHEIDVRVRRAGLTILARDGYYRIPRP